jgi:hypothetical protein
VDDLLCGGRACCHGASDPGVHGGNSGSNSGKFRLVT